MKGFILWTALLLILALSKTFMLQLHKWRIIKRKKKVFTSSGDFPSTSLDILSKSSLPYFSLAFINWLKSRLLQFVNPYKAEKQNEFQDSAQHIAVEKFIQTLWRYWKLIICKNNKHGTFDIFKRSIESCEMLKWKLKGFLSLKIFYTLQGKNLARL